MDTETFNVEEKTLEPMLIAGIRMKGAYSDCGAGFAQLGKRFGRHIAGKPLLLHYNGEYRETGADFEACMPIRKGEAGLGVSVRALPGGRFVTLLHEGPYDQIGPSYTKILAYIKERGYETTLPTREVYLKGPGMLFKGNPKRYLTEIQIPMQT